MRKALYENTQLADASFPMNVFHTPFQDHQFLTLHWHEHFEFILIEQGEATIQIGERSFVGQAGDLFVVNSGELHAVYHPKNEFTLFAVVFHPSLIGLKSSDFIDVRWHNRVDRNTEHGKLIHQALQGLIEEFQRKKSGYRQAVVAFAQLLYTWCCRWNKVNSEPDNQFLGLQQKASRFKELIEYVELHYRDKITLAQAASFVHLSPYHFCKAFKKMTGLTFVHFVNLYRIHEAERLLLNTTLSISEIADRIGCGSINGFSKLFKQVKGFSPKHARALNANSL
ncbi:helix-turn-helix transcriptional regulator [Cohnella mopanensis]|uniref:helix-turn-helix transcriptional regulator n=1 Tax=Cohnella mopanensis TaxID=2911966 RepID=UPI001EF8E331|nr:AraC family transcriptional regulator [Cohnella mopanensis]